VPINNLRILVYDDDPVLNHGLRITSWEERVKQTDSNQNAWNHTQSICDSMS
jgi:hypothetical protein